MIRFDRIAEADFASLALHGIAFDLAHCTVFHFHARGILSTTDDKRFQGDRIFPQVRNIKTITMFSH